MGFPQACCCCQAFTRSQQHPNCTPLLVPPHRCKILPRQGCVRECRLGFLDRLGSWEPATISCSIIFGQGRLRYPGGSWHFPEHTDLQEQGQCDLCNQHLEIPKDCRCFSYDCFLKMEKVTGNMEKYPPNIFLFLFFGDVEKSFNHKEKLSPNVTREFHYFL